MKGLMTNMNRFDFRIYYHIIRIIKTIRRIYYGGERSYQNSFGSKYNSEEVPLSGGSVKNYSLDFTKKKPSESPLAKKNYADYQVGVKIRHKKFGEGEVVGVTLSGSASIEVSFPNIGTLKFILDYAPIEIIK